MKKVILFIIAAFSLLPSFVSAAFGLRGAYVLIPKDPEHAKGYQASVWYDPETLIWRKFHLFFEADFSHYWVTSTPYYRTTSMFTIAPVVRYIFNKHFSISPFLEFSVGPSYLTHNRLDHQKLGEHFVFQDRVGIGAIIGEMQRLSISFNVLHYSNASLCNHNSGITVPLMLAVGYKISR